MKSLSNFRLRAIYILWVCFALAASHRSVGAADIDEIAGKYDVTVGVYIVQQGGRLQIAQWEGDLSIRAGTPAAGELRIIEQDTIIPLPLAKVEAQDEGVKLEFNLSGANNRAELEALIGLLPFPIFSGSALAGLNIDFEGLFSLDADGHISGKFEGIGFSFPGQFDAMYFDVRGPRAESAAPVELPPPPEIEMEAEEVMVEEPVLEEPDLASIAEASFEDESEEIEGLELADYTQRESLIELAAAKAIAEREKSRHDIEVRRRKISGIHTYEFTLNGTEEDVTREAGVNALVASAARLYAGETVLLGRRVLEPYLRNSGDRFILTNKIVQRGVEADGRNRYRTRVTIDADLLYEDLKSKHFIVRSKFRPVMSITLEETSGGWQIFGGAGRAVVEEELLANDMLVETELELDPDAVHMDLTEAAAMLRRMLDEAQRIDVDAIVTGKMEITKPESRLILYDELFFVSARLSLAIYRVDNGQLLRSTTREISLARPTPEEAVEDARQSVARAAVEELEAGFLAEWRAMMLDRSDYRLTVIGIDEPTLERFASRFQESFPGSRLTVKSHFGSVAVINVDETQAVPGDVEEFLRASRTPQFQVDSMGRGRFELRTL